MAAADDVLLVEVADYVALLTLNRPAVLNALDRTLAEALTRTMPALVGVTLVLATPVLFSVAAFAIPAPRSRTARPATAESGRPVSRTRTDTVLRTPASSVLGEVVTRQRAGGRIAAGVTCLTAVAWLFRIATSTVVVVTAAVFVIVPGVVALTTIVIFAVAPAGSVPREQVTVARPEHVPWLESAETYRTPAGSGSVTTTFSAAIVPLLVAWIVYVIWLPTRAGAVFPVCFVSPTSAP